jgi:hypothetical protein
MFNLTISNVPGPPFPLYSAGAQMVAMYPMGPINDGSGLKITVMSYMTSMNFGLISCRETVPEVWDIASAIKETLDEYLKLADAKAGPAKPAAARKRPSKARAPGKLATEG